MRATPSDVATSSSMSAWVTGRAARGARANAATSASGARVGRFEEIEHELGCLVDAERRRERRAGACVASAVASPRRRSVRVSASSPLPRTGYRQRDRAPLTCASGLRRPPRYASRIASPKKSARTAPKDRNGTSGTPIFRADAPCRETRNAAGTSAAKSPTSARPSPRSEHRAEEERQLDVAHPEPLGIREHDEEERTRRR